MARVGKVEARKIAAKLMADWVRNDIKTEGRLDESDLYMELTENGKSKVEEAVEYLLGVILKKGKVEAE